MAGIEVAGLVLGAFPILLSAVDGYQEGAERLKSWWKFKDAYRKSTQDLKFHRLVFEQILSHSLLPLIVDDDKLGTLMLDPSGDGWRDPDLECRLRERLAESYDLYLDYINEVNSLMGRLKNELGVDKKLSRLEYEKLRLGFPFSKSRERLFEELAEYNDRLRALLDLTDKTNALIKSRQSMKTSMTERAVKEFWRHANRLYSLISNAWNCGCQSQHFANLYLRHRVPTDVDFRLLFVNEHSTSWVWQEADIKPTPVSGTTRSVPTVRMAQPASPSGLGVRSSLRSSVLKAQSNQASISHGRTAVLLSERSISWAAVPRRPEEELMSNLSRGPGPIKDLCQILAKSPDPECMGCLQDEEGGYRVYPIHYCDDDAEGISLQTLLCADRKLSRRDRYQLALTIASSCLQLGPTAWSNCNTWSTADIFLYVNSTMQPFVRCSFQKIRSGCGRVQSMANDTNGYTSLGIVLLELCFGTTLETQRSRTHFPTSDDVVVKSSLDVALALQWSRDILGEAGLEYEGAVDWCLKSRYSITEGVQGATTMKEMLKHVIEPLNYCYRQLCPDGQSCLP